MELTVKAYGIEKKTVAANGKAAGRIYLPVSWVGHRVVVALVEPIDHESKPSQHLEKAE